MKRSFNVVGLAFLFALLAATPLAAEGQGVLKRIKEDAAKKAAERKAKAEENAVGTASRMTDSTLEKTGRGVDATVNKVGTVVDTAMNKTERGITNAVSGGPDKIATDLSDDGRAIVRELRWAGDGAELAPDANAVVKRIAKALKATDKIYLVEVHTDAGTDAAASQALSDQRAAALKAKLVAEGVPAGRLFAMGFGGTRAPTDGGAAARIELAKMQ